LELFKQHSKEIQIVLLDVMMPKLDGFSVCKAIQEDLHGPHHHDYRHVARILTKSWGLDIGADDYVVKPFSVKEVMARVRAVLRTTEPESGEESQITLRWASLTIDMDDYSVTLDGHDLALTKKEIELLWTFARNKNKVFTRENLLDSIWGYEYSGDSRTVDSHIKRLRAKLDEYSHPEWDIKTIWGVGYRFEESKDAE
jgi:DNA-binding response OmpR family regulator